MQKRLLFKIGYVCEIPWGGGEWEVWSSGRQSIWAEKILVFVYVQTAKMKDIKMLHVPALILFNSSS